MVTIGLAVVGDSAIVHRRGGQLNNFFVEANLPGKAMSTLFLAGQDPGGGAASVLKRFLAALARVILMLLHHRGPPRPATIA